MKKIGLILIAALLAALLLTPPLNAGGYHYGISYAPINYHDGNYYYHDAGYSGSYWYPAGYYAWANGGWYLRNYGYLYPRTIAAAPSVSVSPSYSADWRSQLLSIAANRDKLEGDLRRQSLDYQHFAQATSALGLQGNFHLQNYGIHPGFPLAFHPGIPSSVGLGAYGVSGDTVYGTRLTYNSVKDVYGDLSPAALYQQSAMLAKAAQELGGKAVDGHQQLVSDQGENMRRVAEVLARAQAAERTFKATEPQARSHEEVKVESTGPAPAPAAGLPAEWKASSQKCIACHSGQNRQGGFDVSTYPSMNIDQKAKVIARLFSTDPAKVMPRSEDGKGHPLPLAERKAWLFD